MIMNQAKLSLKVAAVALSGLFVSLPATLQAEEKAFVDALEDFSHVYARSSNIRIVKKAAKWQSVPDSRAVRRDTEEAYLVYAAGTDLSNFSVEVYTFGGVGNNLNPSRLQVLASKDGETFAPVRYEKSPPRQPKPDFKWFSVTVTAAEGLPEGTRFLKILLPAQNKDGWWPMVTTVALITEPQ